MGTLQDYLKKHGAPAEVLSEAVELEKGGLRQSDYTRKMQEIAQAERQLSFLAGQLQSQNPAPKGAQTAIARYLDQMGDDESAVALRSVLGPALQAVIEDVQSTAGADLQNVKKALTIMHRSREIEDVLESDLAGKYGPDVRKKFPELKQAAHQALIAGREVNLEQMLWDSDPDLARGLLAKQEQAGRTRQAQETTEGFDSPRRSSPPMSGTGLMAGGGDRDDQEIPTDKRGIVDWEAYFAELRSEVPLAAE